MFWPTSKKILVALTPQLFKVASEVGPGAKVLSTTVVRRACMPWAVISLVMLVPVALQGPFEVRVEISVFGLGQRLWVPGH